MTVHACSVPLRLDRDLDIETHGRPYHGNHGNAYNAIAASHTNCPVWQGSGMRERDGSPMLANCIG